ncbi:MAG: hypothetical protein FJW30_02530 [Acidobacteria bacterium]|nr:hypothetical protein [Acidobacteriota bacterium]
MVRRRDFAWFLMAAAPPATAQTAADDLAAAKERVKSNSQELNKFSLSIATEPAFAFKAY